MRYTTSKSMRQNISCRVGQGVTQTRVAQWSPPGVYTRGSAKVGPVASVLLDRGGAGGVVSGLLRVKGPVVEGLVGGLRQEGYRDIRSEKECVTLALCGETLDGVRCESDRIQLPEQRYFGADWWVQSKARERVPCQMTAEPVQLCFHLRLVSSYSSLERC